MSEEYVFTNFLTKSLEVGDSDERTFTGYITAEVIDKQGEFIFVDEMMPIMEKFMNIRPVMSEIHTNRITGDVLGFSKATVPDTDILAIKIDAKVFKSEGVTLYDRVWEKIVNKEYKGLSIGGASKTREPFIKNGINTILLKDLELYEIAICPEPANAFAKIDWVNEFAKADDTNTLIGKLQKRVVQCSNMQCLMGKGLNVDVDIDANNKHPPKSIEEQSKKDYSIVTKPINGHSWEYWNDELAEQYPDKETRGKVIGAMEQNQKKSLSYKDLQNLKNMNDLRKLLI